MDNAKLEKLLAERMMRAFETGISVAMTSTVETPGAVAITAADLLAQIRQADADVARITGLADLSRMTAQTIQEMSRPIAFVSPGPDHRDLYAGMRIIEDPNCLENGTERLFPASKNRSKRIHKKLVKRFGGEFRKVPTMWVFGDRSTVICHPAIRHRLREMKW